MSGRTIRKSLTELYDQVVLMKTKYDINSFILPPYLQEALEIFELSIKEQEAKVLILFGNSNCGKTEFIKSYFLNKLKIDFIIAKDRESVRSFNSLKHKGILFDDASFLKESREDLLALFNYGEQSIRARYFNIKIPANTIKL